MLRIKCSDCECVVENHARVVTCAGACCCASVPVGPDAETAQEVGIEGSFSTP